VCRMFDIQQLVAFYSTTLKDNAVLPGRKLASSRIQMQATKIGKILDSALGDQRMHLKLRQDIIMQTRHYCLQNTLRKMHFVCPSLSPSVRGGTVVIKKPQPI
jgi:hypothetical protein